MTSSCQSWVGVHCVRYIYWIGSTCHVLMILKRIIDNKTLHNSLVALRGIHVSQEHNFLLLTRFSVYEQHSGSQLCIIRQPTTNYQSILIVASFF